jgi:hypothetical protein
MCVPGNHERVSRKGAKTTEGKSRSGRDERHQAIERSRRQKDLGQKNEKRGLTTKDTKHTNGKDAKKKVSHRCTQMKDESMRVIRPSFFCPQSFCLIFVRPVSCLPAFQRS